MMTITTNTIIRSSAELHPLFRGPCEALYKDLTRAHETGSLQLRFELFETFRLPSRQARMIAEGVSKARPFQSAHQFGCAADFVPFLTQKQAEALGTRSGWNWDQVPVEAWDFLAQRAKAYGIEQPIRWDRPHIELPGWRKKIGV